MLEELGEEPHHHAPVLEHVRDARRRAQVVLEHVILAVVVSHDVDAGDVAVDLVGHVHADHRDLIGFVREHVLGGDHAGAQDVLVVIDVVEKAVERRHPLLQPPLEQQPFGVRDDARDGVERDQALGALLVAIDGEGDADAMEQEIGFAALLFDDVRRHRLQPLRERIDSGRAPCLQRLYISSYICSALSWGALDDRSY